jgi:plasmid maintenance system killer protein
LQIEFGDEELRRLAEDAVFTAGQDREVVRSYRMAMQLIVAAHDERDLSPQRVLDMKQLSGARVGWHSMRLTDRRRLIVTFKTDSDDRIAVVGELVDYG